MAVPSSSPSSVQALLKERKYPFIFLSATLLLIILTFLLSFSGAGGPLYSRPLLFSSDLRFSQSSSPSSPTLPPVASSIGPPPEGVHATVPPSDDWDRDRPEAARYKWALCKGPVAVDYIPCLDNYKAIKALKSRRHMEHRERHCPSPAPRCLVPIPTGYKVPVPWPKSRDMVSFVTDLW